PANSPYTTIYVNAGQVNNQGIEASLGYNGKFGRFSWTSNAIFSLNRNKIVELVPSHLDPKSGARIRLDSALISGGGSGFIEQIKTGGSIGDMYANGLQTDGQGHIGIN